MRTVAMLALLLVPLMSFSIEVSTSDVAELTEIINELSTLNEEQARELNGLRNEVEQLKKESRGLNNELNALQTINSGQAFYLNAQRESFDAWAREQQRILQATRDERDAATRRADRAKGGQVVVGILGAVGGAVLTIGIIRLAR